MKKSSRYVFGAALAGMALGGMPGLLGQAHAALVTNADFGFDINIPPAATAASVGPFSPDSGIGSAYGIHTASVFASGTTMGTNAASNTVWTTVAGNGSAKAFTAGHWGVGDMYQFKVPTTGIMNIIFSFDQSGSATGPHAFSLLYSNDGTSFSTLSSYLIATTATQTSTNTAGSTGASSFGTGLSFSGFNKSFALPSIMDDDANAVFEIVDTDATQTGTGTAGTDRIDNVIVAGDAVVVPEPASFALLTVAGSLLMARRRNRV